MDIEQGEGGKRTTAVIIREAANLPPEIWKDSRIAAIQKAVAPRGAGIAELAIFFATAARYDLDPMMGEIWLADMQGKLRVVTGRDSYIKVASREPGYKGIISGVVYANDKFAVKREGDEVKVLHQVEGFDRGARKGAYCVGYHEGRPPVLILRGWADFASLHNKPTWKAHPDDMLETRCIVSCLKRMYNIAGIDLPDQEPTPEELAAAAGREAGQATTDRAADFRARLQAAAERGGAKMAIAGAQVEDVVEAEIVPEPPAGPFSDGPTEIEGAEAIRQRAEELGAELTEEELDLELDRRLAGEE
jgi:hypothetical protein